MNEHPTTSAPVEATPVRYGVTAIHKGEKVWLTTTTDLSWRTMLHSHFDPQTWADRRIAERVYAQAIKDEDLLNVEIVEA